MPCCGGHFLCYLNKQQVDISELQPAAVERYLQQARRIYLRRHGHPPAYKGWRCLHTNGIHMLLRLMQGKWPPASEADTPSEVLRTEICREYARWMTGQRGLARETVIRRCSEAGRFLDWVGKCETRQEFATANPLDVERYMKYRAGEVQTFS